MKNKDKLIIKICKSVIVVFGVLTVFNVIMLVNKKSYALFQKTIETNKVIHIETASEFPSENNGSLDELKEKTSDGIKGVDPETGKECTENCKEYRYVGANVNNYIYFNCDLNQAQSETTCEKWRIVGIFTDEQGEHLKIVKNDILKADMFPETYTYKETTYKIKYTDELEGFENYAYWNYVTGTSSDKNDWAKAGLQYWLNTDKDDNNQQGYLSYLKEGVEDLIETTKYYLGTVTEEYVNNKYGIKDTPKEAYANERAVGECKGGVGPTGNTSSTVVEGNADCRVWAGNKATWEGKVGLLYPSDYGFSADSSNWNTALYNYESASSSSWLLSANYSSYPEWFLSPSSLNDICATHWYQTGYVGSNFVFYNDFGVRPALYLKSNVEITDGTGEETNPYHLSIN